MRGLNGICYGVRELPEQRLYANCTRTTLNVMSVIIRSTHACLTPAATDDSPICPAIRPEESAYIRQAWYRIRLNDARGMVPIPESIPDDDIPDEVIFVRSGRNCVVSTATTNRKTKNDRYTIAV